jgi:alpha-glucoside transport system substrate-binding protein
VRTAAALLLALLLPAACTLAAPGDVPDDDRVSVLGPWTEDQEKRFTGLLDGFGVPYTYQGTAAQREVLLAQVQAGTAPDVAIMPGVGELADYAARGRLRPLDWLGPELEQYDDPWLPRPEGGKIHWVPVKADLKSIVWHRAHERPPTGPVPASSWCNGMIDDGASGWPGSDWIEDIVLQSQGPRVYEQWVTGAIPWTDERVVAAWRAWGNLMGKDPREARKALLADHRGAPRGNGLLFGAACTLEHQGSFATAFYGPKAAEAAFTDSAALLPGGPYPQRGHEVSADFVVMFNDTPAARALLRALVSRTGQERWAEVGGTFSARSDLVPEDGRPDTTDNGIARRLAGLPRGAGAAQGTKTVRCLDASDVMSPTVRDAFYDAVLLHLADLHRQGTRADPVARLRGIEKVQKAQRVKGEGPAALTGVCGGSR